MMSLVLVVCSFLIGAILILLFGFGNNDNNDGTNRRTNDPTNNVPHHSGNQKNFVDKKTIAAIKARKDKFIHINTIDTVVHQKLLNLISSLAIKSDGRSVITIALEQVNL